MTVYGPYAAVITDWRTGAECRITVDLGFGVFLHGHDLDGNVILACRVHGATAPGPATKAGKAARAFAETTCPAGTRVTVVSHDWTTSGRRFDASIFLPDGRDLAAVLIASGHAKATTP